MKIIGKQGEAFIVTITEYEIARIMGFEGTYATGWTAEKAKIREASQRSGFEGLELDVQGLADRSLHYRQKEVRAKGAIESLRELANTMEAQWPSLVPSDKDGEE